MKQSNRRRFSNRKQSGKGDGRPSGNQSGNQQSSNNRPADGSNPSSSFNRNLLACHSEEPAVGARLLLFWEEWQEITNDHWVQGIAKEGLKLDLISHPIQTEWPRQIVMDSEMAEKCDQEVREMLVKQAIVPVLNHQGGFVSSSFRHP